MRWVMTQPTSIKIRPMGHSVQVVWWGEKYPPSLNQGPPFSTIKQIQKSVSGVHSSKPWLNMIDVFTIAFALFILVAFISWSRPVHPITVFILTLLTATWIWANLHDFGWKAEWGGGVPSGLNPVTEAMFYRGWPIAPFMLCLTYFNRIHASGLEEVVLIFDWLVLIASLFLARFGCERWLQPRGGRTKDN